MGGCCGAMKTGQKSLPEKKQQKVDEKQKQNNKSEIACAKATPAESKPSDAEAVKCTANGLEEKKTENGETSVPEVVINGDSKIEEELAAQIVSQAMAAAVAEASAGSEDKSGDAEAVDEWMKADTHNELIINEQALESKEQSELLTASVSTESAPQPEALDSAQPVPEDASIQPCLIDSSIVPELIAYSDDATDSADITEDRSDLHPELHEDIQLDHNVLSDALASVPEANITAAADLREQTIELGSEIESEQPFICQTENAISDDAFSSEPIIEQLTSQEYNSEPIIDQTTSQECTPQSINDQLTSQNLEEPVLPDSSNAETGASFEHHQEQNQDSQDLLPPPPTSVLTQESIPTSEQPQSDAGVPPVDPDLVPNQNVDAPILETVVEQAKEQRDLWWAEGLTGADETPVLETTVEGAKEQRDQWWAEGSSDQQTAPALDGSGDIKSSVVATSISGNRVSEQNQTPPSAEISPPV